MGDNSKISWTDATWNPTTGCTQIPGPHGGPSGCDHCYAKTLINTRQIANPTSVRFGHEFGEVMLHPERLDQPLKWRRPRRIFVNSLSDLFHKDIPPGFIAQVFDVMEKAHWHTFQVLTKRPERMARLMRGAKGPSPNVWLGTSICSNDDAWRADELRNTPAAVRFLSLEPLLGPVDQVDFTDIGWVIVGGESGPGARPMNLDWAREVRNRCLTLHPMRRTPGIPFFLKQLGGERNKRAEDEAVLDGRLWAEFPPVVTHA